METLAFAAALLSALLHASWNAAVNAHARRDDAMGAQMAASGLLALPLLLWVGLPEAATLPWILVSTLLNQVAITALLRAYAAGGFGLIYALVRAVSVLLLVPLAMLLRGEQPGPIGLLGVALVSSALMVLAWPSIRPAAAAAVLPLKALAWTLIAGACTAGYVLSDAKGVGLSGSPWSYAAAMSAVNALTMSLAVRLGGRHELQPWRFLASHWPRIGLMAVASTLSYALIIWVYTRAPIAQAAALRDTSAVFGILIAAWWFKERLDGHRLLVLLLAGAGVLCLRVG